MKLKHKRLYNQSRILQVTVFPTQATVVSNKGLQTSNMGPTWTQDEPKTNLGLNMAQVGSTSGAFNQLYQIQLAKKGSVEASSCQYRPQHGPSWLYKWGFQPAVSDTAGKKGVRSGKYLEQYIQCSTVSLIILKRLQATEYHGNQKVSTFLSQVFHPIVTEGSPTWMCCQGNCITDNQQKIKEEMRSRDCKEFKIS